MSHRSCCNRAFSYAPLLTLVVLAGVAVLVMRSNPTWNGIALGECKLQVVAQLGEPMDSFTAGSVTSLQYAGMDVWLRNDRVYCIALHDDHQKLYLETSLRFGLPIGTWGDCCDWHYGDVVARLCDDKLMIFALDVP